MSDKKIKDYVVGDHITGFFGVRKKEVRDFTKGQYVRLELGDSSGRIQAPVWEPDQFVKDDLAEGFVVKVRGVPCRGEPV